ncbi:MAG TPA: SulP family inorganic anion transporter [Nocardioidaceae bacterium]|nr:SulP family inorganic anion transporter [Nocardioidaceae bacterium]
MTTLVFGSLRGYKPAWLRADVLAGLTVWAVLVPESLAYAAIAGVPPVVGLYAAPPALLLYAAFGSSRHLVVGPMSATAALSASSVAAFVSGDGNRFVEMTAALALMTGLLGIAAGLSRLGFLASFISEPVLKGFIVGLALTIIVGQLPKLIGSDGGSGNFFEKLGSFVRHLDTGNWPTVATGVASLAVVLACKRWMPLAPGSLIAVLGGIIAVVVLNLDQHGVEIVGAIDPGLPSIGPPSDLSLSDYGDLAGPAGGILLIGFAEGLGAAKTYAARAGYKVDANRELVGMGAANLGSGMSSGMVVNGSLSKTAVNGGAGARSQVSGLLVAVLTIVTLLFLTGLFEKLPEATLAAVVIAAVIELVDIASLRRLYNVWTGRLAAIYRHAARADFLAAIGALVGVLLFDTLPGLIIGIVLSLLLLLYRSSRPNVTRLGQVPDGDGNWVDKSRNSAALTPDGIVVVRVEGGMFFANSDHVRDRIEQAIEPDTYAVVIDSETSPFVDVTAATMLIELGDSLRKQSVLLRLAHGVGQVRDVLRKTADTPDERFFATVDEAIASVSAEGPPTTADDP